MERMVTHVLRDADGDITHLCQAGAPWTPRSRADAIDDIRSGVHRYVVGGAGPAAMRAMRSAVPTPGCGVAVLVPIPCGIAGLRTGRPS